MKKKEIELKFLIDPKYLTKISNLSSKTILITQGYFDISDNMRIRTECSDGVNEGYLSIKGERDGDARDEYTYEIPYQEAFELIKVFTCYRVFKTRHIVNDKKDCWEIDVFHGDNTGLIIAELEIPYEDYDVKKPAWIDDWKLVYDDDKFYNFNLARHPYSNWER